MFSKRKDYRGVGTLLLKGLVSYSPYSSPRYLIKRNMMLIRNVLFRAFKEVPIIYVFKEKNNRDIGTTFNELFPL